MSTVDLFGYGFGAFMAGITLALFMTALLNVAYALPRIIRTVFWG